ncbi:hypothetical protein GUJ93_ZPchr0004g39476 [Zizania palustris]|uniref:Uncharacterized protein n=1 Tax=Zizania palustris TaxID=103762 RepID=A0A8J5S0K7_ZIZPA|nr:hypothetical protein GUJ93_ZPchr0004g39476 [Zizania palustris]
MQDDIEHEACWSGHRMPSSMGQRGPRRRAAGVGATWVILGFIRAMGHRSGGVGQAAVVETDEQMVGCRDDHGSRRAAAHRSNMGFGRATWHRGGGDDG